MSEYPKTPITAKPGDIIQVVKADREAATITIDSREYGVVSVTIPPGGTVTLQVGTLTPDIFISDPDLPTLKGDNVVPIDKREGNH